MKRQTKKAKIEAVSAQLYLHALKIKGISHLLEYQDTTLIFHEDQKEINQAISLIMEDVAKEIRINALTLEKGG